MSLELTTIRLALPFGLGTVNCYLAAVEAGHVLIDTGPSSRRAELEQALERAGCRPGSLRLMVLTHGDFDHTGNAAYLRRKFGAPIAMGQDDLGMIERGDMFWNRKAPNLLLRALVPLLSGFGRSERCTPDRYLQEGDTLSEYGLEARVLSLPGHSRGSIGILTADGDLFCGDLLDNTRGPAFSALMDEMAAARASVEKLAGLEVRSVYPGHGEPFSMQRFLEGRRG